MRKIPWWAERLLNAHLRVFSEGYRASATYTIESASVQNVQRANVRFPFINKPFAVNIAQSRAQRYAFRVCGMALFWLFEREAKRIKQSFWGILAGNLSWIIPLNRAIKTSLRFIFALGHASSLYKKKNLFSLRGTIKFAKSLCSDAVEEPVVESSWCCASS